MPASRTLRPTQGWMRFNGLGYMHATDRGTQLLFSRVVAAGEAAGRISNKAELVETDRFFRRVGLHLGLEEEANELDEATARQVLVYCAGVNDGIGAKFPSLPMWATGFQPQRWGYGCGNSRGTPTEFWWLGGQSVAE